jgi:hypothetical protein
LLYLFIGFLPELPYFGISVLFSSFFAQHKHKPLKWVAPSVDYCLPYLSNFSCPIAHLVTTVAYLPRLKISYTIMNLEQSTSSMWLWDGHSCILQLNCRSHIRLLEPYFLFVSRSNCCGFRRFCAAGRRNSTCYFSFPHQNFSRLKSSA